jgi:hypothetical protein
MTEAFNRELAAKIATQELRLSEVLMFAYAIGRHLDNNFCDLFEFLLSRKLTADEQSELSGIEELQHFNVESFIGTPLEAEASA